MKLSKLIIVFQLLVLISTKAFSQNTAISDVTYTPDASAVLDVYSTSKGMLVPRMTQAQKNAITSPQTGLLIYQTDAAAGFWYYDGIQWLQFFNSDSGWMITGNSGTSAATNFLGTTDDVPLNFRVSDDLSGHISSTDISTYFGYQAGMNNTLSLLNGVTFIGYMAGKSTTTGQNNVAVGTSALRDNTTGYNNTAIGYSSQMLSTTGFDNTAVGMNTLSQNTTGGQNTVIGSDALASNTTGTGNTAFGHRSLNANTTGTFNSGIGVNSLSACTTGNRNVAIGFQCLNTLTTASFNTAAGYQCLNNLTTGSSNTAAGYQCLTLLTTGASNTAAGYQCLNNLTTGVSNTAVGYLAGSVNATGNNNTFIGNGADAASANLNGATAIGYNAKVAASNCLVLGATTGTLVKIGVGVPSPTNTLSFDGTAARTIWMERTTTAAANGNSMTLQAGGGVLSGTDRTGGDLNLSSGTSTGTGSSNISLKTATAAGSTGTTDNAPTTKMTILGSGNVGIGTTTPTNILSFDGAAARTIWMERHASTAGNSLTLQAGGAFLTGTNLSGGDLNLSSGTSTGTGSSNIYFKVATAAGSGTADNAPATKMTILGSGNVGIGTTTPTNTLSFDGAAARTIWMERHASTTGNSLTLQAGGAFLTGTNLSGGDLNLSSGTSTGTGSSNIYFKVATAAGSGTADNAPATKMTILGNGNVGIGTLTPNTTLQVSGSFSLNVQKVAGAITFGATDYIMIYTAAGANTCALPTATAGRLIIIVNHGTGALTTSANFRTANAATANSVPVASSYQLVYDGTEWRKIN